MRTIYLIRHAKPLMTQGEKCYLGHTDPSLSAEGVFQSESLARDLVNAQISDVYCSDLIRAQQTAAYIAKKQGVKIHAVSELRELNMGVWDGLSFKSVRKQFPGEYDRRGEDLVNYNPPGGESFLDLSKRVIPAFESILQKTYGNIAIISHAGVNRVILCYLNSVTLEKLFSFRQDYACVNIVDIKDEKAIVRSINVTIMENKDLGGYEKV